VESGRGPTPRSRSERPNAFLADPLARGLTGGTLLVTCDAHAGPVDVIAANLFGTVWQRCANSRYRWPGRAET
jgi:transposase-like protein